MKILLAPSLKIGFTVFSMLLILLAAPLTAHACACCADAGTWFQSTAKADPEVLAIVGELGGKLGATATLSLTAAGLEEIKGITAASETYSVRRLRPYRRWDLEFTDQRGNRGTVTFTIPDTAVFFAADLQDDQQAGAGGPLLYKEWRFEGPVSATGIFRGGMTRNTRFRLIFQGRGNMCRNEEDFRSWILKVKGPRADYTFYGSVSALSPDPGESADFVPASSALQAAEPLYFASPREAVPIITGLLRKEDWNTLSRYYDLSGAKIERGELESGRFFIHEKRPEGAHPGLPWKYKQPFTPGFKFDRVEETADPSVARVIIKIEIDVGGGMVQRGLSEFKMRKSDRGYQLLPPDRAQSEDGAISCRPSAQSRRSAFDCPNRRLMISYTDRVLPIHCNSIPRHRFYDKGASLQQEF